MIATDKILIEEDFEYSLSYLDERENDYETKDEIRNGASGINGVHLFRVEVEESEFKEMKARISKTIKTLDIDFKQRN